MIKGYRNIVAYIFVQGAHDADYERIFSLPSRDPERFHSAVRLIGPWDAMVVVTVDDLIELEDITMRDVRGGNSPSTSTALSVSTVSPPGLVTWTASPPVISFSQVKVLPGRAAEVMEAIAAHPNVLGVAGVAGSFDVLAEFGGETYEEVANIIAKFLASVPGVATSSTAFSTRLIHNT